MAERNIRDIFGLVKQEKPHMLDLTCENSSDSPLEHSMVSANFLHAHPNLKIPNGLQPRDANFTMFCCPAQPLF